MGGGMGPMGGIFSSMGGMPGMMGGMGGRGARAAAGGARRARKRPTGQPCEVILPVSLSELANGAQRKMKISRRTHDAETGRSGSEDQVVNVDVQPGFKDGTKITFDGLGDETEEQSAGPIVFVLQTKPHPTLRREGADLRATVKVSLRNALSGTASGTVDAIDGTKVPWNAAGQVLTPKTRMRLPGKGMPRREHKQIVGRGDLILDFEIEFPKAPLPADKLAALGL